MKRRYHVFLRQHANEWYTASLLVAPRYAAYGPHPSELLEEIAGVVAVDLANGEMPNFAETWFENLKRRALSVDINAVQHQRLTAVPMRFSVLVRAMDEEGERFEVRIPRLDERFVILGEENVLPWAEEVIRGRLHLADLTTVLSYQMDRSERLEMIEVSPKAKKRKKRQTAEEVIETVDPIASIAVDLVGEAKEGRLRGALHRDEEVNRLMRILGSRRTPSCLIVGPSGIGKTAIVEELAKRLATGAPAHLEEARLWQATAGRILADAQFLGDWQARARQVVERISAARDLLYLGDLAELLSSGSKHAGMELARFFVAPLESGELSAIAEATPETLVLAGRMYPALVRSFQLLQVAPLSSAQNRLLIEACSSRSARDLGVEVDRSAIDAAIDVTIRFGEARSFPGSAIDLLERATRLHAERGSVDAADTLEAFSSTSGFPVRLIDRTQSLDHAELRDHFEARVVGQPAATERLVELLLILKAGLNDPDKPLGSFLFMGPTGVGKTEAALSLAEYLFNDRARVLRFDMSEYGYPGSALRLIDGPRGEGELTRRVREQPFAVLLFDELEKADAGVFDLLLQLLGEGRLTDGTGRTVSFVHTIVVMTSNLGAKRDRQLGFTPAAVGGRHYVDAAERFFRPELVNRFDHVVPFAPLSPETLRVIANRMLETALTREGFARRGLTITYEDSVLDHLVETGFDERYGARPMKRAVESYVIVPLAKQVVARRLEGKIRLSSAAGRLVVIS